MKTVIVNYSVAYDILVSLMKLKRNVKGDLYATYDELKVMLTDPWAHWEGVKDEFYAIMQIMYGSKSEVWDLYINHPRFTNNGSVEVVFRQYELS